jgi:hypothetical protein
MTVVRELGQITDEIIEGWLTKYEKREDGYYCQQCGSRTLQTTCYVSIHASEFEPAHAGPGHVVHIIYPYCPKCDGEIDHATACYHAPILQGILIGLGKRNLIEEKKGGDAYGFFLRQVEKIKSTYRRARKFYERKT